MTTMQTLAMALAASKEEKATTTWWCPHLLPPSLMVLIIVIIFNATSLLPAVAPVDCGILLPLGSNTWQRDGDHGGGIPPTAGRGTNDIDSGGGCGRGGGDPKQRMMQPSWDDDGGGGDRGGNLLVPEAVSNDDNNNVSNNMAWGGPRLTSVLPCPPPRGQPRWQTRHQMQ